MNIRDRAYFGTSALLYSGPLYAGLAGFGLQIVPVFTIIFMVWLYVIRPDDWPKTREAWRSPRAIAWPLLILAVQFVLVTFCIIVGRAMGGVLDITPPFPLMLTVLISFLGIALARLLQPKGARYTLGAKKSLSIGSGVLEIGVPAMPGQPAEDAYVEGVMMYLADFGSKKASRQEIAEIVSEIEKAGMARPVLAAFMASRNGGIAQTQAQSMLALRPSVAKKVSGEGVVGKTVTKALSTWVPQIIEDTARDAKTLLSKVPGIADELPSSGRLEAAADSIATGNPNAAEALRALSNSLGGLKPA